MLQVDKFLCSNFLNLFDPIGYTYKLYLSFAFIYVGIITNDKKLQHPS